MSALAASCVLLAQCATTPQQEIEVADGGCVTGRGPVPQCATTFCPPESVHVVVDDRAGASLTVSIHEVAPSGPFVGANYTAPDAYLYVSFATDPNGTILTQGAFQY